MVRGRTSGCVPRGVPEVRLPAAGAEGALEASHRDLYERAFWTEMQKRIRAGELVDIFPYRPDRRLA